FLNSSAMVRYLLDGFSIVNDPGKLDWDAPVPPVASRPASGGLCRHFVPDSAPDPQHRHELRDKSCAYSLRLQRHFFLQQSVVLK
ncbi:hypothetical protein, partial [Faecalibaculum rodentium]|uniref:hypothetical protein n=1 Tax=Faecalibaculum rodentium TaxID=1702221 RepID=UPI00255A804B